jgi:hypothetical protein
MLIFLSYSLQYSLLLSVLVVLSIIFYGKILFWSCLFGVLENFCTWMGNSFSKFGNFYAATLLIMFPILLACSFYLMPMVHRFGHLMDLQSSYTFLSQPLHFFSQYLYFFSLISICLLVLKFCFPLSHLYPFGYRRGYVEWGIRKGRILV